MRFEQLAHENCHYSRFFDDFISGNLCAALRKIGPSNNAANWPNNGSNTDLKGAKTSIIAEKLIAPWLRSSSEYLQPVRFVPLVEGVATD